MMSFEYEDRVNPKRMKHFDLDCEGAGGIVNPCQDDCTDMEDTGAYEDMDCSNEYLNMFPIGQEGMFDILPDEMRDQVFTELVENKEWKTLITASRVNWRWKIEIDYKWRQYCDRNKILGDEEVWAKKGKNWKWLCMCMTNILSKDEEKNNCFGVLMRAAYEAQYEGEWKENKKDGVGRIWWANGDRFIGDWKADTKDGFGVMIWDNGDRYDGGWRNDLREGAATYTYANGGQFCGTYLNDERHGEGAFIWPDGDRFEGNWRSGGRYGKGYLITKDGQKIEQDWNENPYVSYSTSLPAKNPEEGNPPPANQ